MATLNATHLNVLKNILTIPEGHISNISIMFQFNLTNIPGQTPSSPIPASLNTLAAGTKPELSQCYHATLFSPFHKTLLQAIKRGQFFIWLKLTLKVIKHLPPSMATEKLHMKQIRKNICYTWHRSQLHQKRHQWGNWRHAPTKFSPISSIPNKG